MMVQTHQPHPDWSDLQENKTLQSNILKFCFVGAVCVLLIAAICLCVAPEADAAVSNSVYYEATAVTNLNVRSGPGTDYPFLRVIPAGTVFRLSGGSYYDGVRTYWRLYGPEDAWVTGGTNGANIKITTTLLTTYTDTIKGYAADGSIPWEHTCTQSVELWYYHISVTDDNYTVTCDCGWTVTRDPFWKINLPDYLWEYSVFLGLDTDNNEQYDLKSGQSIDLPCRAVGNMRPYIISEFIGDNYIEPPTATVGFYDSDGNLISKYTFNWNCTLEVKSHGILLIGNDGSRVLHPVDGDYMLWYDFGQYYLAEDKGYLIKQGDRLDPDDPYLPQGRHVEYRFTIKLVNLDDMNPLDWIVYVTKKIGNGISELLNFFGLGGLIGNEDSPFIQAIQLDGVQQFFSAISSFFSALPPELIVILSIGFVGTLVIGLVRWFL